MSDPVALDVPAAPGQPFTWHHDEAMDCDVHDNCGGPIVGNLYRVFCLRCRPELLDFDAGVSRWILRWLRDNGMLDALINEDAT